jgi:sugar fermentation stimulation protein A
MAGCDVLGSRIWFSHTKNPRRKFPDTWELVEVDGGNLVCVNTQHAKQLILEAIESGTLSELQGYTKSILEPPYLEEEGLDLLLEKPDDRGIGEKCFAVIKGVTLGDEIHRGFYPDSSSQKGVEQVRSLMHAKQQGYRAVLIYCVLHTGVSRVFPADHIDPDYGNLLRQAYIGGVEVIGYRVDISLTEISVATPIEVCIPARMICAYRPEKSQ